MFLARNDPLGTHNEAIRHILRSRGDGQLYSPTRFSLWRLTHYRLQAWQTLFREQPDEQQIAWIRKLNTERPDLRICAHVLQMNVLSAAARMLTQTPVDTEAKRIAKLEHAKHLAREMQDLTVAIEDWTEELKGVWEPKLGDVQDLVPPQEADDLPNLAAPPFSWPPCPKILSYDDLWVV
jgi:hypothetical protein